MRKGFTLIELIFAIVIIGVLAAVAVPKFSNLKQNAEVKSVIKVAEDAFSSIPSSYVNLVDLEEDATINKIQDLVTISGNDWNTTFDDTYTSGSDEETSIVFFQGTGTPATDGSDSAVVLTFNKANRNIRLQINCDQFTDSASQTKCADLVGTPDKNVSF